jgi:hypothetical protein
MQSNRRSELCVSVPAPLRPPLSVNLAKFLSFARLGPYRPSSTVAATRPNKEHHYSLEFPFLHLALAIRDENDRTGGGDMLNGREKVPVPPDRGNSQGYGKRRW